MYIPSDLEISLGPQGVMGCKTQYIPPLGSLQIQFLPSFLWSMNFLSIFVKIVPCRFYQLGFKFHRCITVSAILF